MRVAIPAYSGRISPVFDAAGHLLVIDIHNGEERGRNALAMQAPDSLRRARWVAGLGVNVLICGAISWPLAALLESAGVRVIARKCGDVEEVLRAFMSGGLSEDAFVMPGCRGRRWRQRGGRRGCRAGLNG